MKRKIRSIVYVITGLAFFGVLIMQDLNIIPYLYTKHSYFDLNSFDFRYEKYIFSLKVGDKINESTFSKELHRLDINVPDERVWKYMSGVSYILPLFPVLYADGDWTIIHNLQRLFLLFEINEISDNERIAIIEEILPNIKDKKGLMLDKTFEEITNKHGYDWKHLSIKNGGNNNQE